uniref:Transposase (Putative), gypsy type n=1 Tax=Tanacetum cinerariifolium TaxID=118510 RepID=A0A6L2JD37_TANCI|nr:hypothetical protein [Tanacetum cinerariifolium]
MGRDTIQIETAVSNIFQEYLLEFTSEYDISEDLHPEFPGPEERIVDFSEDMDLFNLISSLNPSKVKTDLRPCAAHEVPLLTATASQVIDMEDPDVAAESSGTPSAIEKSPLEFDNENPSPLITEGKGVENQAHETVTPKISPLRNMSAAGAASEVSLEGEVAAMGPRLSKKRRRRVNDGADANAPPKVLRKDYASVHPEQSTREGKTLMTMGLAADSTFVTPANTKGVSDPDPLSYTEPQPYPEQRMTQYIPTENVATMEVQGTHSAESAGSKKSTTSPSMVGSPGGIYQPGWSVTNSCRLDTPDACQDVVDHIVSPGYFSELRHMPNVEFLSQYNKNLAQRVAMGSQLRLCFEQEVRMLKKARKKPRSNLKTLLEAEADMKKATEAKNADLSKELESLRTYSKKYEDDRVEKHCAEIDARLDALNINFDEELYPHMLTAIAGRRWVIEHGLRLAVMKCEESIELRQAFANVVSARIYKGMSEGMAHGIEHGKACLDLEVMEAYDPEANSKYLQRVTPKRTLLSGSATFARTSQLKIPVYPKVRDPRDPWAVKEKMLLEEAIAANVSRAEKKKRCRVVCGTHGAISPIMPNLTASLYRCLPLLLKVLRSYADAATQIETSEDDASLRFLRSKSLPPMYNLDWP